MKQIQKHISIPEDFLNKIEIQMKIHGQKFSPLINSLLRDYFKIKPSEATA